MQPKSRPGKIQPARQLGQGQARCLQLAAQGLLQPPRRRARPTDVIAAVERMRLLQIDSIHVVARSPYLVLHARLGDYQAAWLDTALEQGRLAECWAHEACFVPASDLPLHRTRGTREGHWAQRHAVGVRREQPAAMEAMLARIRDSGAVRAADFRHARRGAGGWWAWKPEKRQLEAWFALGELMVSRRERFQRVYDLSARVLARLDPPFVACTLSPADLRRRFIADSVRALGIAQARWVADYYRLKPAVEEEELAALAASGELIEASVSGWDARAYVHRDHAEWLAKASQGRLRATHTALLSPFDPLVWDRARVRAMFDFEYAIECYTPAAKRCYGYYVLPMLHRGRLIGRLDAKAHRAEGVFEIKSLHLEAGTATDDVRMQDEIAYAIAACARWHDTPTIRLRRCQPAAFGKALRRHWRMP